MGVDGGCGGAELRSCFICYDATYGGNNCEAGEDKGGSLSQQPWSVELRDDSAEELIIPATSVGFAVALGSFGVVNVTAGGAGHSRQTRGGRLPVRAQFTIHLIDVG